METSSQAELKAAYDEITATWKFYRANFEVSQDDEYWNKVIEESNSMTKKNPSPLLRGMIGAVIQEMERRSKQEQ